MNTTYFLNCVAGNLFKSKTSPALPTEFYIGLSSSAPNKEGSGVTEPKGGAYERLKLTGLGAPDNGVVTNTTVLEFPESTVRWGVMTHYAIFDAKTDGHLLMYDPLVESRTVESATIMRIKPGALRLFVQDATT